VGDGTSPNSVRELEGILQSEHLRYAKATSRQLNAMSAESLAAYELLIVPGGNFIDIGNSLTPATCNRVRDSVTKNGVRYLGICAGAILAGHNAGYNSFDIATGVHFPFYAASAQGVRKTMVPVTMAGRNVEQYWEDGPQLTGWGTTIGTYPDGTPALPEGPAGRGWMLLTGVHPEAPESWRKGMAFQQPVSLSRDLAARLIRSALARQSILSK
jgi:glutamine amidotransferase-like uncharacterized protein